MRKPKTMLGMNAPHQEEPRLPQIDPVSFAALSALDNFIARAPLTRQEHADANRSLQHLVQTIESLQATVKQLGNGHPPVDATTGWHGARAGNG